MIAAWPLVLALWGAEPLAGPPVSPAHDSPASPSPTSPSLAPVADPSAAPLPWIRVAPDGRSFAAGPGAARFIPWGFNYDHDRQGRLLEDYWQAEWATVIEDFGEMRQLGANVARVHLQLGKFLESPTVANQAHVSRLRDLLRLAERERIYLDVTGLGCYHKADVPAWYDALTEEQRWDAQARFWEVIAECCASSPAVFCYDLMNEPVAPAGKGPPDRWLGPGFAGKHFVQYIATDAAGRERADIGRRWVEHLVAAIRRHDARHLITVGLVDWSLERPGLTSGMVPAKISGSLDFLSVHLYPSPGKLTEDLETLAGFAAVGKPVVIEETFPLKCSAVEFREFLARTRGVAAGWIGFYWGETREELEARGREVATQRPRGDEQFREAVRIAMLLSWLDAFRDLDPNR